MKIEDVLKLARPNILGLEAYSTARDDCGSNRPEIFLDANENPYNNGINRYPDPHQKALKSRISEIKGIAAGSLFLGNGSDEAMTLCTACSASRERAIPCPSPRATECMRLRPR